MWIRRGRGRPPLDLSPVRSSPSFNQQVVNVPEQMVSSIRFKEEKGPCMFPSPSQMETLEEGNGDKGINRKRSIMEACNHRDMYSPLAGACDLLALSLSASSQVLLDEELDKHIPFKKRITSLAKGEEMIVNEEEKEERRCKVKARLTTLLTMEDEDEEEEAAKKETKKMMKKKKKKMGKKQKGLYLMEGSRCSRVNGRGWRCNQKTLVGYALCEHHLERARNRSVNSVASRNRDARIAGNDNGPCRRNMKEKGKGRI